MNRCNVDYYTYAHYSGGMLYQKNQVATDDISQEYIRTNTKILRFSGDCQISKKYNVFSSVNFDGWKPKKRMIKI